MMMNDVVVGGLQRAGAAKLFQLLARSSSSSRWQMMMNDVVVGGLQRAGAAKLVVVHGLCWGRRRRWLLLF
jgi:hypothetical protein